jgi:hypothetical protein
MVTKPLGGGVVTGTEDGRGDPALSISLPERMCVACGVTLPTHSGRGRPRLYCVECNDGHGRLRGLDRRRMKKPCSSCGAVVDADASTVAPSCQACRECRRAAVKEAQLARRRLPPHELECSECGTTFQGRKDQKVCSRRCKDRRYVRLHPVEYAAKQARKYRRRIARLRGEAP